ncbi:DUF3606 domain-containing protein [Pedobacter jamesrossensis]|uniref:DUF3606 domain-containing protein n=1 Tax=Pedobacter jamesrossensis TaxID=1908238 RepID=A0ABV8NNU7_9SPHI
MPWYNGDFPPSYKNQPDHLKEKAVEIANALLSEGVEEGIAIATGLKRAREFYKEIDADKSMDRHGIESDWEGVEPGDFATSSGKINPDSPDDLSQWAEKFQVSVDELKAAILMQGNSIEAVKNFLQK